MHKFKLFILDVIGCYPIFRRLEKKLIKIFVICIFLLNTALHQKPLKNLLHLNKRLPDCWNYQVVKLVKNSLQNAIDFVGFF